MDRLIKLSALFVAPYLFFWQGVAPTGLRLCSSFFLFKSKLVNFPFQIKKIITNDCRIVRTRRSRLKIARKRLRTKLPRERGDPADRTHSNKSLFFHVCFLNYLQTLSNSFLFKQNLTNCLYIKLFSIMSLLDIWLKAMIFIFLLL